MLRRLCVLVSVAALIVTSSAPAEAQKGKPRSVAAKRPAKPAKKAEAEDKSDSKPEPVAAEEKAALEPADKADASSVKAAGTSASPAKAAASGGAVTVKETKEGVKTYKFGTIEVEGRSKSPEILYFLRRVRAEFDASALGHRSFMRELSDTRNRPSFR